MIKQAEINSAYQQGVQAALIKLSQEPEEELELAQEIVPPEGTNALINFIENQKLLAQTIGLGASGFTRNQHARDAHNVLKSLINGLPEEASQPNSGLTNLLTTQNMGRLGMLGGAVGGTLLGDRNLRSAALSTAGAVGGGMVGANLASGINKAVLAYKNPHYDFRNQQRNLGLGGLVGGLTGGLAAGRYL
jgi:hypothetical protein